MISARVALGDALTARERAVMALFAKGFSYKEIASKLSLSAHTVKFHVCHILTKLGVSSTRHAVVIVLQAQLDAMTAARDEACDLAEEANGDPSSCSYNVPIGERIIELRKVGSLLGEALVGGPAAERREAEHDERADRADGVSDGTEAAQAE